jgi:hypothetical protein
MKISIKNTGDPASTFFAKMELDRQGILYNTLKHGEVEITNTISEIQMNTLAMTLKRKYGLDVTEESNENTEGYAMNGKELKENCYQFSEWGI